MRTVIAVLTAAIALVASSCREAETAGDVGFAKSTFESLVRGDSDVATKIDWETFTSLGVPIGEQYVAMKSDEDRSRFKTGFITQFSSSFRESGASFADFTNWRVTSHDDIHTVVTADSAKGLLNLTVSERDSTERLSAMEIVK